MRLLVQKISAFLLAFSLFGIVSVPLHAGEKAPPAVIDLAHGKLAVLAADPVIVQAVKAANAKGVPLEKVKELNTKWAATAGVDDFIKSVLSNSTSQHLREIQKSKPYYAEIFLKDAQAANVAMTDKTSSYWHGDKDKFTKAFSTGDVFVGDVSFDKSSQVYSSQVSLPVKDGSKVIGVLIVGIDIDQVK